MLGNLYFIREGVGGPIKIGWTSGEVIRRRDMLQTGNSQTLDIVGFIEDVAQSVEAEWHLRFRDLHLRAEWFLPARPLLNAIADQAVIPEQRSRRSHMPRALSGQRAKGTSAGARLLAEWMAKHDLTVEAIAELTEYQPAYLADLLADRAPFGRESAKRFYALAGAELHPADVLADMTNRKHIVKYLARTPRKEAA